MFFGIVVTIMKSWRQTDNGLCLSSGMIIVERNNIQNSSIRMSVSLPDVLNKPN